MCTGKHKFNISHSYSSLSYEISKQKNKHQNKKNKRIKYEI